MKKPIVKVDELDAQYQSIFGDVSSIIDEARQTAARSVNAIMTAAYWMIGQHIVEFEQGGKERAEYGTALVERLAVDLTERFGRGFSRQNIWQMRLFYQSYPPEQILQTVSGESESSEIFQTLSEKLEDTEDMPATSAASTLNSIASRFPLPWSAYVRLLSVKNINAREFYETEALRGGWSIRQLDRHVAQYALGGLTNNVMPAEYRTTLPDEELLAAEIDRTRQVINLRATAKLGIPEDPP